MEDDYRNKSFVKVGNGLINLIEAGINEDADLNGSFKNISDEELEYVLNNQTARNDMYSYLRMGIIKVLEKIEEKRRNKCASSQK